VTSSFTISPNLLAGVAKSGSAEMRAWLATLPNRVADLRQRWGLDLCEPFQPGGNASWVAPARDGAGRDAVLKVAWTHIEARDEAEGLAVFGGEGAVEVYAYEHAGTTAAMLLERCRPGDELRSEPEDEQHEVVTEILPRLWRVPLPVEHGFRLLSTMCEEWADPSVAAHAASPQTLDPRHGL
jgi:streptomycin 6-kinase